MTSHPLPSEPDLAALLEHTRRPYHAAKHGPEQDADDCGRGWCPRICAALAAANPPEPATQDEADEAAIAESDAQGDAEALAAANPEPTAREFTRWFLLQDRGKQADWIRSVYPSLSDLLGNLTDKDTTDA